MHARAQPDAAATRAAAVRAFHEARDSGDVEATIEAALRLPSTQFFGTHPGQVPALIHLAYVDATGPAHRCRLAAALARAWAYGGEPGRAVGFGSEALRIAEEIGEPFLLADALDAALVCRWGPDDFADRLALSARLTDTAAHLAEPAARRKAHLWRLTTSWECLDMVAVQRQLRALDLLAEETGDPRDGFFAASRRAMNALVLGDIDRADRLIGTARELGAQSGEPDLDAVLHSLVAARAHQVADLDTLREEAPAFEAYGAAEGVPSVSAEGAVYWLAADRPAHAERLLRQLAGAGLHAVPRDVDFLLTITSLVHVAAHLGRREILTEAVDLLAPYAGRAVLNAGAVTFHGVVDDYLYRAEHVLGGARAAHWRDTAALAYERIGAAWWRRRLDAPPPSGDAAASAPATAPTLLQLYRDTSGRWVVGQSGSTLELPDWRGLHYLRELLRRPGVDMGARELAAPATPRGIESANTGDLLDRRALAAYRRRLDQIDAELDEAKSRTDQGSLDRLHAERDALLDQLRAATGLGGRRRRFSSTDERARVAVRKAIAATLDRLGNRDPVLARFLRDTIHTGTNCRYEPDPARPVTWLLDPRPPAEDRVTGPQWPVEP